jgi:hypothetical protein
MATRQEVLSQLPYRYRVDIETYVQSVRDASPDIFREARVEFSKEVLEALLDISLMRKLSAIVSMNFWALDSSLRLLAENDITVARAGSAVFSKESWDFRKIEKLYRDLRLVLQENGVLHMVEDLSYSEVVRELSDGNSSRSR